MRLVIRGHDLPGASYAGRPLVGVGIQVGTEAVGVVRGDATSARWEAEVRLVTGPDVRDFRGPAVHGRRGDRFVYLTWGDLSGSEFAMLRRAKLMLDRVDPALVERAERTGRALVADVSLTDASGGPRCARVDPPAISWSVAEA